MKPPFGPILIPIAPGYGIHWYGVLIVVGIVLAATYAMRRAREDGENPDHVWNTLVVAILLGIVGARLYHVFSEPTGGMVGWSYYRQHPIEILYIWQGGLGIYGVIIGGILGVLLYTWWTKLNPWQWLDYGAPGLALAQAIGRWGNFINQELYGPPTTLPWGLIIDPEHRIAPYDDLTRYPPDTLFHPTFLYESLYCLLLFIALTVITRKLKGRLLRGDIISGYLIGYPLGRFFTEYLRPDAWRIGPLAAAQWFAITCMVTGLVLIVVRHVRAKRASASAAEAAKAVETTPPQPVQD